MKLNDQLDLFAPKIVETPWTAGERRRLSGYIGRATVEFTIAYDGAAFRWSGDFYAPTFGTGLPLSAQPFSSARSALGAATGFFRSWLDRNGESDWRKRFDRWSENKTLSDFQKIEPPPHDNADTRDHPGALSPMRP